MKNNEKYLSGYIKAYPGYQDSEDYRLLLTIYNETKKDDVQYGYPRYSTRKKMIREGKKPRPGMEKGTTWCIYIPHRVMIELGYDPAPFLDKTFRYNPAVAIHYTTGQEMYDCAIVSGMRGEIIQVNEKQAQAHANNGIPVIVVAKGRKWKWRKGCYPGHAGVVAPCRDYPSDTTMIGQVGGEGPDYTGFTELLTGFDQKYVEYPRFYVPKKINRQ